MYHILCVNIHSQESKQNRAPSKHIPKENMYEVVYMYKQQNTVFLKWLGKWSHCKRWSERNTYVLYLWVEADLADVTGDDWPLGFDQWNSKGVVDYCLLHRVHLPDRITGENTERGREKRDMWTIIHTVLFSGAKVLALGRHHHHNGMRSECAMHSNSDGRDQPGVERPTDLSAQDTKSKSLIDHMQGWIKCTDSVYFVRDWVFTAYMWSCSANTGQQCWQHVATTQAPVASSPSSGFWSWPGCSFILSLC